MQHSSTPDWIPSDTRPPLRENEIHVWRIVRNDMPCRADWLSEQEQRRYATFERAERREQYCQTRIGLRTLLSRYLNISPEVVPIQTGRRGKPYLADEALHFNLTHARDTILLALSPERPLGIDLEYPRRLRNILLLARRVFTPEEIAELKASAQPQRRFLKYWTRYEAAQKCSGEGIFGERAERDQLATRSFPVGEGVACLAWPGSAHEPGIRWFDYVPSAG